MKARDFKRIWGYSYDFSYLLKIERRKIKEMARDFTKWKRHVGWERTVWEMNVCIQLIDIILEEDKYYKSWLHNSFGGYNCSAKPFPIHVNVRNISRFMKNYTLPENSELRNHIIPEIRRIKALYLYNRIRALKLMTWWD